MQRKNNQKEAFSMISNRLLLNNYKTLIINKAGLCFYKLLIQYQHMQKIIIVIVIIFCSFFFLPQIYFITQSQSLNIEEPKVVYPLPYPGILSDHPLFFAKEWR